MAATESTLTAEALAQLMGVPVQDVAELKHFGATPLADGTYQASRAIKAAFSFMRDRWEFTSNTELAELMGVTKPRISHLVRDGTLSQDSNGRHPRKTNYFEIVRYFQEKAKAKADAADHKKEKIRLEKELLQIQLDKARGITLQADEVERAWSNIILLAKQRLLRIPNKVSPRLPFCKSEVEMETEIQKEVDEALLELSRPPVYESTPEA